jgi:hypothetical protein
MVFVGGQNKYVISLFESNTCLFIDIHPDMLQNNIKSKFSFCILANLVLSIWRRLRLMNIKSVLIVFVLRVIVFHQHILPLETVVR